MNSDIKLLLLVLVLILHCPFVRSVEHNHSLYNWNTSIHTQGATSPDYEKLVEYANIASFAYCVKTGLAPGKLGLDETHCKSPKCRELPYKDIEVVQTFDSNTWGEVGSGFYALDKISKRILMVLRGTSSGRDLVRDLDFRPVKYSPVVYNHVRERSAQGVPEYPVCDKCKVHNGFYTFLKKNCQIIEQVLQLKERHPEFQLVIVGHSLGAALALLASIEFQLMGLHPLVVCFGSPRVGNKHFAAFIDEIFHTGEVNKYIDEKHDFKHGLIQVVHKGDIVPYLPPVPFFKQSGYQYYIDKGKLPHTQQALQRMVHIDKEVTTAQATRWTSSTLWLDFMGKYDHSHYFTKITECGAEDDDA